MKKSKTSDIALKILDKNLLSVEEFLLKLSKDEGLCWCKCPVKVSQWIHDPICQEIRNYFAKKEKA